MLPLIRNWLEAGVSEDGEVTEASVGTQQGAVVRTDNHLAYPAGKAETLSVIASRFFLKEIESVISTRLLKDNLHRTWDTETAVLRFEVICQEGVDPLAGGCDVPEFNESFTGFDDEDVALDINN